MGAARQAAHGAGEHADGKIRVMTTDPMFPEVVIPLSGTLI